MKKYFPDWIFTKTFLKIALPVIMGQMLITGVSFLDNFMVGNIKDANIENYNELALTSVMITNELLFVAMGITFGMSAIGDIFAAQFYGAKKIEKFKESLRLKTLLNIIIAIITSALLFSIPKIFIGFFVAKNDPDRQLILNIASDYAKIMSFGHLLFAISYSFVGSLTIIGHPKFYFYSCLASLLLNGLFNYIFMYVLDFGVKGAAYSTISARLLELLLILFFVYRHRITMWFGWNLFDIDKKIFLGYLKRFELVLSQVAMTIGLTGQTAIWSNTYPTIKSGLGIGYAISGMLWTIIAGLSSATKVLIGHKMGAGKLNESWSDSKKLLFLGTGFSILIATIMASLSFVFPYFFNIEEDAEKAMSTMILLFSLLLPFWTISTYFFSLFETGGFTRASTILGSYYVLFIVLPFSYLMGPIAKLEFWQAFLLANSLHAVTNLIFSIPIYKRKKWLRNLVENYDVAVYE